MSQLERSDVMQLPSLRHHDPLYEIQLRRVLRGYQLKEYDGNSFPIAEDESEGDVLGALLWKRNRQATVASSEIRACSGWMWAWPTVVTRSPVGEGAPDNAGTASQLRGISGTTPVPSDPRAHGLRPARSWGYTRDLRFPEKEPGFAAGSSKLPRGWPVVLLAGTDEHDQVELAYPAFHSLVAPWRAGSPHLSTLVSELTGEDEIDLERQARINTTWRVVREPSTLAGNARGNAVAWQLGLARGGLAGLGLVSDVVEGRAPPAAAEPAGASQDGTLPRDGRSGGLAQGRELTGKQDPTTTTRGDAPAGSAIAGIPQVTVIGATGRRGGGPFEVPPPGDQHEIGRTADGEPVFPVHLRTLSLFRGGLGDGPMHFEGSWIPPMGAAYNFATHLRWDAGEAHEFIPGHFRFGRWKWETEAPLFVERPPHEPRDPEAPGGGSTPRVPGGGPGEPGWQENEGLDFGDPKLPPHPPGEVGDDVKPPIPLRDVCALLARGAAGVARLRQIGYSDKSIAHLRRLCKRTHGGKIPKLGEPREPHPGGPGRLGPVPQGPGLELPQGHTMAPTSPSRWGARELLGSHMEYVAASCACRAMRIDEGAPDLRYQAQPSEEDLEAWRRYSPVVIREDAVAISPGNGAAPTYTHAPGQGPYPWGSAGGFRGHFAPETGAQDHASSYLPAGVTLSTVYDVWVPPVRQAWGIPDPATGGLKDGHASYYDRAGNTIWQAIASGTVTERWRMTPTGGSFAHGSSWDLGRLRSDEVSTGATVQLRRGTAALLPTLAAGEVYMATDTAELFVGY